MRPQQALAAACLASPLLAQQPEPALQVDWKQSPVNGHWYGVDRTLRLWGDQEALAQSLGGHLATVRSQSEQDWLVANLLPDYTDQVGLQIGANDEASEGTWVWSSGEPWGYTNWGSPPDNAWGGQDHAVLVHPSGLWDDYSPVAGRGVIETITKPQVGWSWPQQSSVSGQPRWHIATDLDEDGLNDLVLPRTLDHQIDVLLNTGAQWVHTASYSCGSNSGGPVAAVAGDFNEDGHTDIAVTVWNYDRIELFYGDGTGMLVPGGEFGVGDQPNDVAAADFNSDGHLDLLVPTATGDRVDIFLGAGTGAFGDGQGGPGPAASLPTADKPFRLALGDLNGDGISDLVVGSGNTDLLGLWLSDGVTAFVQYLEVVVDGVAGQLQIDENAPDGKATIYLTTSGGTLSAIKEDASGSFAVAHTVDIAPISNPNSPGLALADWDHDGDLDLCAASNADAGRLYLVRTLATGSLSLDYYLHCPSDVEHIVTAISASGSLMVSASSLADVLSNHYSLLVGDCDGDGVLDADEIAAGATDCNGNGIPDECDIANGLDCNGNGIPDSCDIASGSALDCNNNGIPDDCDIANDPTVDANLNGVPDSCEVAGSRYWILSPVTGNWYAVTDELRADEAAQVAINWGGDLVTINDQAENDWLAAQFGNDTTPFWIGLNDVNQEGIYEWFSGEPVIYTNWRAGEPDNAPGALFGADFAVMFPATATWLDEPVDAATFATLPRGVVELVSSDCDSNGIPDTYELLQDPSLDCDGNGIHDLCDLQDPALDCDGDGVLDSCQIAADPSLDCDSNGAIDSCEILADPSLDCDADQTLDVCQITADPSLDWNGDGLIDTCAGGGFVYCDSNLNAVGLVGSFEPQGSPVISDDSFTLYGFDLPLSQPAMVIMSRSTNYVNPFGGGAGVLCLGAPIRRFNLAAGFPLQFTSPTGDFSLSPPIGEFPGPNAVLPGEVIHFQLWHREFDPATGTPRSNTTDGISVMFR